MQELTLVGVTEDGAKLLLTLPDGRRFALRIDERVRAATRGGAARSGQLAIPTETMRPKDIQARLRAGATLEEVAEVSGWSIERVESFAFPVMQERSFVAGQARDAFVRHLDGELELGEVVTRRLAQRGVDESELRWDAWRSEDGQWTVLLAFPAGRGDQVATWIFDPESRTLHPIDDEARTLLAHHDAPAAPEPVLAEPDEPGAQIVTLPPYKDRGGEMEGSRHPAMRRTNQDARDHVPVPAQNPAGDGGHGSDTGRGRRASVPSWDEILFGGPGGGGDQG